ncbi:MAG: thiamine biosynthesis protein ThiS [Blastocatellia bacterium]
MRIFVNGEERELDGTISVTELLERLALPARRVAVERNRSVLSRADWDTELLTEGDRIEIVHFVGGG